MKILFVEDEPDIRFVVELAFKRAKKFTLTVFDNAIDALEQISGTRNEFDLLLSDVQLPGMSGPEFVRRLKTIPSFEEMPVVFLTGSVTMEELDVRDLPDVLGVISKPFDALFLPERVEALMKSH
jgi:CheY-like chemotaxis protein